MDSETIEKVANTLPQISLNLGWIITFSVLGVLGLVMLAIFIIWPLVKSKYSKQETSTSTSTSTSIPDDSIIIKTIHFKSLITSLDFLYNDFMDKKDSLKENIQIEKFIKQKQCIEFAVDNLTTSFLIQNTQKIETITDILSLYLTRDFTEIIQQAIKETSFTFSKENLEAVQENFVSRCIRKLEIQILKYPESLDSGFIRALFDSLRPEIKSSLKDVVKQFWILSEEQKEAYKKLLDDKQEKISLKIKELVGI